MDLSRLKIRPSMLVLIFIIFSLIIGLSFYSNYMSQKNATIELMNIYSENLAMSLSKTARMTFYSNNLLRHYYLESLESSLLYLDQLDANQKFKAADFDKYLRQLPLDDFIILDETYRPGYKFINTKDYQDIEILINKPEFIRKDYTRLGTHYSEYLGQDIYSIMINRTKGGFIIGSIRTSRFAVMQNLIGVSQFLEEMDSRSNIKYIIIQDSTVVQYQYGDTRLSSIPLDSPLLEELKESKQSFWHISENEEGKIFEFVQYFHENADAQGFVKIGLDYSPLRKIQEEALKQAGIRLLILFTIGFILIAYSVSIQNQQLLNREKDKITQEVYTLQTDLRQKERLSVIGELAAGVAHKIRNPLNAISMTIQRLGIEFKPTDNESEYQEMIHIVRKEIRQLGEIITQFLQFSKPSAITKSEVDINTIINNTLKLYESVFQQNQVNIVWDNPGPVQCNIDAEKISQCLQNLLENSIYAMNPGGTISIKSAQNRRNVIISISDTGYGIKQEVIPKIYNLYYTTKADGTGIGLAEVYQIITEHNGRINVESIPGSYTTFTITLPKGV